MTRKEIEKGRIDGMKRPAPYDAYQEVREGDVKGDIVDTRWVDSSDKARSRIMLKDYSDGTIEGFFAGTPDRVFFSIVSAFAQRERRLGCYGM